MDSGKEPQVILYDLACTKDVCFSPAGWRVRLMLNYKHIPYRTVFVEFPDIEPKLKELGISPDQVAPGSSPGYTVPVIHHIPTKTYMKDSVLIGQFLESKYPDNPVILTSEFGQQVESQGRKAIGGVYRLSAMAREMDVLSPRSQEYFRRTREADLGHPLEDLLDKEKEDQGWKKADPGTRAFSDLILTHKADGPYVLGAKLSWTDFFIAGFLQCMRVVNEDVFQRLSAYPGLERIYEACVPYMDKKD